MTQNFTARVAAVATALLIGLAPAAIAQTAMIRGKVIDASQIIDLSFGDGQAKSPLYGRLLRSVMADQVAWIRDRTHERVAKLEPGPGQKDLIVGVLRVPVTDAGTGDLLHRFAELERDTDARRASHPHIDLTLYAMSVNGSVVRNCGIAHAHGLHAF